jgi:hypothetical protein
MIGSTMGIAPRQKVAAFHATAGRANASRLLE